MSAWRLVLSLDHRDERTPLFVRIAHAVARDVRRGRLRLGERLPGARALAQTLGVDRDTVTAAYRELRAQGWIEVLPARGAFVTQAVPDARPQRVAPGRPPRGAIPHEPRFALEAGEGPAHETAPKGVLDLANGVPDLRGFPLTEYARALRRQLRRGGTSLLRYGDPRGHARLRAALADMLSARRGIAGAADDLIVVRGSQMALDLVARALVRPGDAVLVEELGYRPAWAAFEAAGARLLHVPVDREGIDVAAVEAEFARRSVRAVYVTPHHQYPTTVTMSPARRLRLLDAARRHRVAIVEDDYDHEIHFDGRPVHPLASMDQDGVVVYVGTLSKTLAPALRIGYVVAPRRVVERLAAIRHRVDRQGDTVAEAAVADLLEEGAVQRHVWRMQRLYRGRRDALVEALGAHLARRIEFDVPSGGMALWARAAGGVDVERWARRSLERGVVLRTGRAFTHDRSPAPFLRLHFAALNEREIAEAVRRMSAALRA